jgi:Ca2+-binding RTX toxin-like protein
MPPLRLLPAALLAALAFAAPAGASTVGFDGHTVTYTAAPGEPNQVTLLVSSFDTTCGAVPTPCLALTDSYARITATGGCELTYSGLGGDTAACPLPQAVQADLGDGDDSWYDWDGPSTVDGGAGNDNPMFGGRGDDVLRGGSGNDVLYGEAGNDTLDGGTGDDDLEGIPGVETPGLDTLGADTYIGGGGADSVQYDLRSENLTLSPDGSANDGAPGEGDNIGADVLTIIGGNGDDTLIGNAGPNYLVGGTGNDVIKGGAGEDFLYGSTGNDALDGQAGQDFLEGDSGDDTLTGGPDLDTFYGEDATNAGVTGRDQIYARDGNAEPIHCGPGIDSAQVDSNDAILGTLWTYDDQCESVDGAAGGGAAFAVLGITADRHGRLVIRLSLPSAGSVAATATARAHRIARGRASFRLGRRRMTLKLTRAAKRELRRGLKVTVRVAFTPTGGKAQSARKTLTLRAHR